MKTWQDVKANIKSISEKDKALSELLAKTKWQDIVKERNKNGVQTGICPFCDQRAVIDTPTFTDFRSACLACGEEFTQEVTCENCGELPPTRLMPNTRWGSCIVCDNCFAEIKQEQRSKKRWKNHLKAWSMMYDAEHRKKQLDLGCNAEIHEKYRQP